MKKLCILLAALLMLLPAWPVHAEEDDMMVALMLGDWVHDDKPDTYLLFDGVSKFCGEIEDSSVWGFYDYVGDNAFLLTDDLGVEHTLTINDDLSLSLTGVEGFFNCQYRYLLMDFPATDEGTWLHDDGTTELIFDIYGDFEMDTEDAFYYGPYKYLGSGEYLLTDEEDGVTFLLSLYDDDSLGIEGLDGYFWPQESVTGDDPFAYIEEDWIVEDDWSITEDDVVESLDLGPVTPFEGDPIPLSGTWYKFGDASAIPFILDGDGYFCESSVFTGSTGEGTWTLEPLVYVTDAVETAPSLYLNLEPYDGSPSGWNPVPLGGNRLLYSNNWDTWFLHESEMGTETGETLIHLANFLSAAWWLEDSNYTAYLDFIPIGNAVIFGSYDENGEGFQELVGQWVLTEEGVAMTLFDGITALYPLPAASIEADGLVFIAE